MSQEKPSIVEWISDLPINKKILFVAGGLISVSAGGYLVYKQLSSSSSGKPYDDLAPSTAEPSTHSPDLPADPTPSTLINQQQSKTKISPEGTNDKNQNQASFNEQDLILRVDRMKEEGNKCFRSKNYEKALKFYNDAVEICPVENRKILAALHQNMAAVYEQLNDYAKVCEQCNNALKYDKRYTKALSRRGNAYQKLEDWSSASHDFVKCSILERFANEEMTRKADQSLKTWSRILAKEYMKKRLIENKPRPLSKTVVKSTLKSFSYDPVLSILSQSLNERSSIKSTEVKNVEGDINGVIIEPTTDKQSVDRFEKIAQLMREQRFEEIVDVCTQEIDAPVDQQIRLVECLLVRAFFNNLSGHMDVAKDDLAKVVEILEVRRRAAGEEDETSIVKLTCSAYTMQAFCLHLTGDVDAALKKLEDALTLCPENPDIYSLRGQIKAQIAETDIEDAIADFRRATQLKPDCLSNMLQLLATETKYAAEKQDSMKMSSLFEQIKDLVAKNATNIDANLFYSQMMLEMEQLGEASKHLQNVLKLDPNCAEAIAQLALIDLMNGREAEALKSIEKALEIDPYCLMVLEMLAQYHSKRSDVPKLMECYEKVLQVARSSNDYCTPLTPVLSSVIDCNPFSTYSYVLNLRRYLVTEESSVTYHWFLFDECAQCTNRFA
uniref:Mitochondrial import receptor subunit TOM70 n=1 Tax=Romanomermis culicivorax TaxID=13658 RepID=A0A915I1T5_ROMCU